MTSSTNANANQTPPRSATFPFTLSTLNSFNPFNFFNLFNPMEPDDSERRSRDTRPQPAWRHPATPYKAARISNTFPIIFHPDPW